MTGTKMITVATDFSRFPAGRFISDGRYSGERFREEFLKPMLLAGGRVVVALDGVMGVGSSFLEEAFGGLIRSGVDAKIIKDNLEIRSSNRFLVKEILSYIDEAVEQ
jgi:hypothetical protein